MVAGCSKPTPEMERNWQINFKPYILNDYSDFRGHLVEADVPVFIFSYKTDMPDAEAAFSEIVKNNKELFPADETSRTIALRSSADTNEFDEAVFAFSSRRVYVLVGYYDSPVEISFRDGYLQKLHEYAAKGRTAAEKRDGSL